MELGNFLGKLKGEKKVEPKKFLALVLTDEVVQAAVWNVVAEKTEIVSMGTPVEWDGDTGTTGELIAAVDATISSAVEGLSIEPNEVILGIPHTWTDKNGILGVKREFIGKIKKELELTPLGFVVITDSILSYLKMQEGTPTTSILIQVSRDELTLVLVRLGRIEVIETIGRSDDIVEDVTEGISRFKITDNLPSRIILFNSMHNLDDIIQNLLSINWQTEFNFLHLPKIEALAKDVTIRALALAGGSEVAKSLGFSVSDAVPAGPGPNGDPVPVPDPELLTAEEIGFTPAAPKEKIDFIDPDDEPPIMVAETNKTQPVHHFPKISFPKFRWPKINLNLPQIKSHWWIFLSTILLLSVLIFSLVWLIPRATLAVQVIPKALEENVDLTLSTSAQSIDFAQKIVPAQVESLSESGEKIAETTGKKIVGDPSKGEVTIYNRTSATKNFPKGTTLSSGNLKFTLDEDALVASKSASSDYVDIPGKSSVKLTASSIGEGSNLPSGTEFTIGSFGRDSYVAKNDSALTGGTSEEVQVVSKDDQKNLVKALTDELLTTLSAKESGNPNQGLGVYLIPDSAKVDDVSYSAKTGEASKTLTAKLTIKVTLLKYNTADVTTLVDSQIDQAVPTGYARSGLPSTVDLTASKGEGSETLVRGNALVHVSLLPIVDIRSLQSFLKGKKTSAIENILSQAVPGYQSVIVVLTPRWIPTRFKSLPQNPKNIEISIIPSI